MRVGIGYDIHRTRSGGPLFLGGIEIGSEFGLVGHSDGDCLIHAIIDALLGAAAEGDIGQHFPPSDKSLKGVRSTVLLKKVMEIIKQKGLKIIYVDSVIVAEKPKMAPHILKMKKALAPLLEIPEDKIGIKAKTNERLGEIGRLKAIACWAVCLLEER
ncbi:MAG: 2-C-methyl-D-erythritol 2,4-cyclodiphosphate synthase [Candidatus Aminicenantes bacterium]|nr:2-C-methyl-D-erythritol 2,4-cyclodiphosphate synthase [Candidatus Aminicenantes bacterium]